MLRKTSLTLTLALLLPLGAIASGPWLPERLLQNGGKKILDAPEFYFELEMKQLATHYPTPFQAVTGEKQPSTPEPQQAEAALYQKGAAAFHAGQCEEARAAWQELLALPETERRALSISAAYMLGRMQIDRPFAAGQQESGEVKPSDTASAEPPKTPENAAHEEEAISWFRKVRALAQSGFADPDGLAAASLGWEAYTELHRGAFEQAATLYLQQLAAGDLRAVGSLRTVAGKLTEDVAAKNPLLRRIKTAEILCYEMPGVAIYPKNHQEEITRSTQWLAAVEKADIAKVEEAERLGWLAYCTGKFDEAARWLQRAEPDTGLALWLRAKLLLREGKLDAATAAMARAIRKIPDAKIRNAEDGYYYGHDMPQRVAAGDYGLLLLARSDFLAGFHQFLQGNHWEDAAFVAERILTLAELRQLVNKEFPALAQDEQPTAEQENFWYDHWLKTDHRLQMRWLLGRRLVRAGELAAARPYLPLKYRETLDRYASALQRGENRKAAPDERARNLFEAATILRRSGMELMGTEVEPDSALSEGMFPASEVWEERLNGKTMDSTGNPWSKEGWTGESAPRNQRLLLPVSATERKRLQANTVEPEKRFHYRYIAADLAWRAAKLLPDNDERTADVLNTAGNWLKNRDDAAADRFLQAMERRCPHTEIGKAAMQKHWFVDKAGPWSCTEAPEVP